MVGGLVDFGGLVEDLPDLGDFPLAGDFAAVARQESFAPLPGDFGQPGSVFFCGVVLPQLHIGIGRGAELGQKAQRRAVCLHGKYGAGGEIRAHADDIGAVYAALAQHVRDGGIEHVQVILGILQGPVLAQGRAVLQGGVHHGMGIVQRAFRHHFTGVGAHQHRAAGQGAKIDAEGIFAHNKSPLSLFFWWF